MRGTGYVLLAVLFSPLALRAQDGVQLQETPEGWQVETPLYRVLLSRSAGGAVTQVEDKKSGARLEGTFGPLTFLRKHERQSRDSSSFPAASHVRPGDSPVRLDVLRRDARSLVCRLAWNTPEVNVEETLTFTSVSRVVWKDYRLRLLAPVEEAFVEVHTPSLGLNAVFLPDGKRVSGREGMEFYRDAPGCVFAYDPDQKSGVGLAVPRQTGMASLCCSMNGVPEGAAGNRTYLAGHSRRLAWEKVPVEVAFRIGLIVGGSDPLEKEVVDCVPASNKPVVLEAIWPVKLIHHTHEKAHASAVVHNQSGSPHKVQLVVDLIGGIEESRTVFSRPLRLAPQERRPVTFAWDTGSREYGFELRGRLLAAGREIDRRSEYTTVADTFTKVAQMTVLNPAWASKEGQEKWLIPHFRRNYTGLLEYYCWAPSHLFELTPDTAVFEPHTESQSAYRATITRKFLQDLIASAHRNGLRVVAELAQFSSLPTAQQHPEQMQYTEDGQFYIFARKVFEGEAEFATVGTDYYSRKEVIRWTQEMAASTRMFGWDGVRFDCGFLPTAASADPLYAHAEKQFDWFDFRGRPARERFPDPDATGAELCHLWRERMKALCPGFHYLSNHSSPASVQQVYPKLTAAMAREGGGLLQEDLLRVDSSDLGTWEKWAAALRDHGRPIRELGGQPLVGWMPWGPEIYARTMHYLAFASGYHLYAWAGPRGSLDETWKHYRFAARFSEYFYDPQWRALPLDQEQVAVTGAERVLWKYFVYERQRDAKVWETIVDLLNLPEEDTVLWQHDPPPVKRRLQVRMAVPPGYRFHSAWMLAPEPEPRSVRLTAHVRPGQAVLTVPELVSCAVVVGRFTRGRGPTADRKSQNPAPQIQGDPEEGNKKDPWRDLNLWGGSVRPSKIAHHLLFK